MNLSQRVKQFFLPTAPRSSVGMLQVPILRSLDPQKEPLHLNSVVMSLINWAWVQSSAAPLAVFRKDDDATDQDEIVKLPLVLDALNAPVEGVSAKNAAFGMWISLITEGTAFFYPVRDARNRVVGLQYLYHYYCQFEGGKIRYTSPSGETIFFEEQDLIILRYGIDPEDSRKGYSPLKACLREVMTDQEASEYLRAILSNFGIVGSIISSDDDNVDFDAEAVLAAWKNATSGSNRGKTLVSNAKLKIQQVTSSPKDMILEKVRNIPEQRICAVFGIPPAVLQLASGQESSTYNNLTQMIRLAWNQFLIPITDIIASQLTDQFLRIFTDDLALYLGFDRRTVEAMHEDRKELESRYALLYQGGIVTLNEARTALDFEPAKVDGFYQDLSSAASLTLAKARFAESLAKKQGKTDV